MLKNRKIAVFIDVDNAVMEYEHYDNVMQQLRDMGEIVCGTVYGVSERKHKMVIEDAKNNGYDIKLPMRIRRRVRKVFDDRIYVDVATLVARNTAIDTVAIVSGAADLVYLIGHLRKLGLAVVTTDNLDEQCMALVSDTVDLGKVETIKLPKKPAAPKKAPAPKAQPQPQPAPVAKEQPAPAPKAQPQPAKQQPADNDIEDTEALIRKIQRLSKEYDEAPAAPAAPAREPQPEPVAEQPQEETPLASYVSQNDSDLIRKIEELRRNSDGNEDEVLEKLKGLLDEVE